MAKNSRDSKDTPWCTMHDKAAQDCSKKGHGPDQLPKKWFTKNQPKGKR